MRLDIVKLKIGLMKPPEMISLFIHKIIGKIIYVSITSRATAKNRNGFTLICPRTDLNGRNSVFKG